MQEADVTNYILSAASGDELARERLINHYKPYIINTVGHVCRRYITWSDEESSIGLLAFNRAIETYDINAQKSFLNYVYLLVKRDLIDHFRRERKVMHLPLEINHDDESPSINLYEVEKSMDSYQQTVQKNDLIEEILELSLVLSEYGVEFDELENFSPKHRKTKEKLVAVADDFLNYPDLVESFLKKKRLPVSTYVKKSGHRVKTFERHRKYIVTLVIVKLHPEWRQLSEYIQVSLGSEENHEIKNV
ncbi:hypothetical protein GH741_00170 [Aquibacillus halophilus]|uniref:RNA polymerase sigma factor SigI n=1 Tax=Aquibacillus halophilus TaxID=930132 RepID=A0A6A8D976_9BACI|nr:sigma factor [Aquibacillus halophilus]MRH41086.1 hypothetical protein [Aquibacillus halophilus]